MFKQLVLLSAGISSVYGHAFINAVSGANGITGVGLGVTFNGQVPRNGTTEQPFQLDTPVLKDTATDPCGATLLAGSVNIATAMANVASAFGGLPTIPASGTLTMGVFQVNADGGGPFAAEINTDATGTTWTAINVVSQPPGVNGILHNGPANSSITVQIPPGTTCTGTGGACLIRLNNGGQTSSLANGAGPFGGCVAVAPAAGAASGAASTTASTKTSTKSSGRKNAKNQNGRRFINGRHFYPSELARRNAISEMVEKRLAEALEQGLSDLVAKRDSLNNEIIEKRQLLSAQLLDELSTVTGTAIDIPIDRLAGHDDAGVNGGNSTAPAANAVLTTQQAIDLKKAVQLAINQATALLASSQVDAGSNGQNSNITDAANAQAAADQAAGTTSINAGNAGVGFFQTAVVDSLLGQTATQAAATQAAATQTATTATATATAATTKKKGKNNNRLN
ncbi:hypothetical protein K488DRAFT_11351, partial [Vararia minispora EC-137]